MDSIKRPHVLIIGAGPTGLGLAALLAAQNLSFRLLSEEASLHPLTESRAEGNHTRTLAIYEKLGLLEEALNQGHSWHNAVLRRGRRELARVDMEDPSALYPNLLLRQPKIERLFDGSLEKHGLQVERGWRLTELHQDDIEATAEFASPGGESSIRVTADYIVACDGGHSEARRLLGASFVGKTTPVQYALADCELAEDNGQIDDSMQLWMNPMMLLARIEGRLWRAAAQLDAGQHQPETPEAIVSALQERLDRNGAGVRLTSPVWTTNFRANTRRVDRLRFGRVFLAGDAAHVHPPAGGQGMNEGLQDALNLAWKLTAVLNQGAPASLLDSYHDERMPIIKDLLAVTSDFASMSSRPNSALTFVRDLALPRVLKFRFVQSALRNRMTGAKRHLRGSSLTEDVPSRAYSRRALRPGDRAPDAFGLRWGPNSGLRRLYELLAGSHTHELLAFAGQTESLASRRQLAEAANRLVSSIGSERVRAHVITRSGEAQEGFVIDALGELHRRFGARAACFYLLRPDGFIGLRAPIDAEQAVQQHFVRRYGQKINLDQVQSEIG